LRPFAPALAEGIPPVAVRLRRDFGQVLNLVRAYAILHQATRARDGAGRILATLEDYAVVRELVADIISEGVEGRPGAAPQMAAIGRIGAGVYRALTGHEPSLNIENSSSQS
jgi:hypothetical protein